MTLLVKPHILFPMINDKEFLEQIMAFIAENQIYETVFGLAAVNDGNFIKRLKNGGSITLRNANKVSDYMDKYAKTPDKV